MLDTNARKYIQPLLGVIAKGCQRPGISANTLTIIGMLVGVAAAGLVATGYFVSGFAVFRVVLGVFGDELHARGCLFVGDQKTAEGRGDS